MLCGLTNVYAQWVSNGTQLTSTNITNEDPRLASNSNGDFYMSWVEYGTVGDIKLNAFDELGNPLSGWPAGGVTVNLPNGDYWAAEVACTKDDMVVISWFGYTTTGTGSDRMHVFFFFYDQNGNTQWNSGTPIQ